MIHNLFSVPIYIEKLNLNNKNDGDELPSNNPPMHGDKRNWNIVDRGQGSIIEYEEYDGRTATWIKKP